MSQYAMATLTPAERAERRELDEACFHAVEAYCADGIERTKALSRAAASLRVARNDVVAGYWRHVRREGFR